MTSEKGDKAEGPAAACLLKEPRALMTMSLSMVGASATLAAPKEDKFKG